MGTNLVDVRDKIDAIDEKVLNLLLERMELMPQVADAKYAVDGEKLSIRREDREQAMYTIYTERAATLAKKNGIIDPEIFEELVLSVAKGMVLHACKIQQKYLEKEYGLKKEI